MNYVLELSDAAKNEIEIAFFWYETEQEGLGLRFLKNLEETISLITNYPKSYPIKIRNYHECYMGTFPFVISYQIEGKKNINTFHFSYEQKPQEKNQISPET